jgi:predicted PolB exonuclease-like 3'-5' exonuclease
MSKVVFDVEAAGDFENLDKETQDYFLKYAKDEKEIEEVKKNVNFWPFTGQIVAISLFNPESDKGKVFFQAPNEKIENFSEDGIDFEASNEKKILEKFWQNIKNYHQFITFNGRGFDCPYLMLRSAVLEVRPTRNLMPPRYSADFHIDLLDQLTFYGAFRKFTLDFYCKSLGIQSSKANGLSGEKVGQFFKEGRYLEIARYCLEDTRSTAELYRRWLEYIAP